VEPLSCYTRGSVYEALRKLWIVLIIGCWWVRKETSKTYLEKYNIFLWSGNFWYMLQFDFENTKNKRILIVHYSSGWVNAFIEKVDSTIASISKFNTCEYDKNSLFKKIFLGMHFHMLKHENDYFSISISFPDHLAESIIEIEDNWSWNHIICWSRTKSTEEEFRYFFFPNNGL